MSFLITPGEDVIGGDTVVGPNKGDSWESSPIADLVFSKESTTPTEKLFFETDILPQLKGGSRGQTSFRMKGDDGMIEEICLSFAPVTVQILLGVDPSTFGSSVKGSDAFVYSVAVGKPCSDFQRPLEKFEKFVNEEMAFRGAIYSILNMVITFLFVIFSGVAAVYISKF